MEIRLPKELISFFWFMCLKRYMCHKILPTTEVATNGTNKSWGVVEDFAISRALKLGCAPGLQ